MAKRRDYGFVRSYASIGSDPTQFRTLMANGYAGALFNYDDPMLAQAVHDAQQAGMSYGFWGDPNAVGNNAAAYIARMQQLNHQYRPDLFALDLENSYKGDPGSAESNRMLEMARMWQAAMPGVRTAIAPLGSTHGMNNWNVGAWGPNTEWMPQAYGANPQTDIYGPNDIVQSLIRAGVDPSMISPILGPGHYNDGGQGYGGSALWTIDDFAPYGNRPFPKASGPAPRSQDTGGQGAPTRTTTGRGRGPLEFLGKGASQSAPMIQARGLQWGGQNFGSKQEFAKYLASKNKSYATWAQQHAPAAGALAGRK
jgi:hypothetical protein